jgi:hypothetical protein
VKKQMRYFAVCTMSPVAFEDVAARNFFMVLAYIFHQGSGRIDLS